ncbi:dihydropteroate synthase [Tuwongella immobilis]|uniref:Dihydropteroate synthase n=1 Tax=Tuwongella immobilis TaxID=692036 RepID=A0A6C2YRF7_9BACT|nr:dihydropteroate synthase [Tuwongella immobilis]VIP03914.1 dihydropteroate synthase : Dihydropteroate synthase OS=uncultured planctomycete GN=HGMM_F11F07C23 PE=3 SV=1: Pterin_bind [Tuwongella immobilis]VTS05195.1 dihydropteroate synthase : Dihydropteroate synthase OS=uncultured planctomycete GN=HGMM_F11F07C23 PE=3 SV=1: Pterin_bind [Tuwongella immobilis]
MPETPHQWHCRQHILEMRTRPLVMGILNVTPDSFSDGGKHLHQHDALEAARRMIADGADILDIGGESSRPGSQPISLDEELQRVIPVVERISAESPIPISVDTTKPEVARQALQAGACIINDITALRDPAMVAVARDFQAGVALMHMQGTPATMQQNPQYEDVVTEVRGFLESRLHDLIHAGIAWERMVIDPGIGFGKTIDHNLRLLAELPQFLRLNRPVLLGVSRKGFIGTILQRSMAERLAGSLAVAAMAVTQQSAQILRVHDVAATRDVVVLLSTIRQAAPNPGT